MTAPGEEIVREVRERFGPRTLLSFSRGKDAIAAYLAIQDHFDEIIPYHLYGVPNLEFIDESLAYYERVLGCKIYNLPHPGLYEQLNGFLFQTVANGAVIEAANLPNFTYLELVNYICEEKGIGKEAMVASGVRAADSPIRRLAMIKHGAINESKRQYYPVWDWNKARVVEAITKSGIKLPIDYDWFGRTWDGLDMRFLYPLKQHSPADFRRVLEWFPLAEAKIWMHERTLANG